MASYLIAGGAFFQEDTSSQYLLPGSDFIMESVGGAVTGTIAQTLFLLSQQATSPSGGGAVTSSFFLVLP
jgi:hypothetical protein